MLILENKRQVKQEILLKKKADIMLIVGFHTVDMHTERLMRVYFSRQILRSRI
jgi:hypothetical protein